MSKQTLKEQLDEELGKWQTKIDEAKVQMHLGAKEAEDKIQPYVDQLEQELSRAKAQWNKFESSSESAWNEIERGVNISVKAMKQAFEKAEQHFPKKEEK
jgi:NAD-specific glutamate dehydrogenase